MVNARDLGGLPAGAGRTRPGVLLRSDAPYLGDAHPEGLVWPPATVVDLRDPAESARSGYPWPGEVEVVSNPLFSGARLDRAVEKPLIDIYRTVMDTAAPRVVAAIDRYSESGATVVHCAAGKDRTGIVVAVSLRLAGVAPEAIVEDYQRTEDAIEQVYHRMRERRRLPAAVEPDHQIFRTPRPAIELVLDRLESAGGAWEGFEAHGGDRTVWTAGAPASSNPDRRRRPTRPPRNPPLLMKPTASDGGQRRWVSRKVGVCEGRAGAGLGVLTRQVGYAVGG